jgi:thioesterase domain-containing protein
MTRCLLVPMSNEVASVWETPEDVVSTGDDVFVFPATVGQQGFWYLDRFQPGNPAYNIAIRFRLQGPLRVEALERAVNEIVRRHEVLRTVFTARDGVVMQVVTPQLSVALAYDDLRRGNTPDRLDRAEALATEESRRRFDLAKGPLIRARLLQLDDEEHVLLLTVHHIVSDGWSLGVITQELGALYEADCRGFDPPLSDLALQYGDVAVWQERWLNSRGLDDQLAYWARQLRDLPPLEIPTDRPRPPVQTNVGQLESLLLPPKLTDDLESLSKAEKVTPYMVTLAAFQVLLQRRTGRDDIAVGSVQAGRSRVEFEPLIGLFINSLVLRTDLSGDPTFVVLLARVRETVLQAFANQDVPFGRVVEAVQLRRDPSRHPLFQINFMHQRAFLPTLDVSGLTLTPIPSVSPGSIYDVNLFLVERAEGWRASCEYNSDLYDPTTIRLLLRQFQGLLEGIVADPTRPISSLPLTSPVGREASAPALPAARPTQSLSVAKPPAKPVPSPYVAPRDSVETRLAELWERALGHSPISITANFFDLGGHSLLAARLLFQIDQVFGKVVPFATFLQAPTIEAFAQRLHAADSSEVSDQVHWINPDGSRPLWVVITSQPQLYRSLTLRLGSDQPILGLTSPELAVLRKGFTVEDVAANLVKALRSAIPHGPYYLGGWCVSGVIAYEMSRQLQDQGEEVALLTMLDSYCPVYVRRFQTFQALPIRWYHSLEKYAHHLKMMRQMRLTEMPRYVGRGARDILGRWRARVRKAFQNGHGVPPGEDLKRFSELLRQAAVSYEPKPTTVPVALFRSEVLHTGWFKDPALGWPSFARSGLTLYELPGDHDEIFREPIAEQLANNLADALARAANSRPTTGPAVVPAERNEGAK